MLLTLLMYYWIILMIVGALMFLLFPNGKVSTIGMVVIIFLFPVLLPIGSIYMLFNKQEQEQIDTSLKLTDKDRQELSEYVTEWLKEKNQEKRDMNKKKEES